MTTSDATRPSAAGQQVPAPAPAGMANPAPWAVTAFATTSFMLGMYQTGPGITIARIRAGAQDNIKASTCMRGIYDADG